MKQSTSIFTGVILMTIGLCFATQTLADPPYGGHGGGYGGGYGAGMEEMMHHGSSYKRGDSWKNDLSDEQRKQIDRLGLDYKKAKYLLKAQMKQAKIEFALLITEDSPNQSNIDKKIGEIVKLKSKMLRLKADHKIAVRNELNSDQRVKFDLAVLKKANEDKREGEGHGHGGGYGYGHGHMN